MGKDVETLIVKAKVKEFIKGIGEFNVSADFYDAFNKKVAKLAKAAVARTKANGRKTVAAKDV
jgi:histone H3/H4